MSDGSTIQWTDATWNFVRGCTRTSEGCLHCYIDRTPPFRIAHNRFDSPDIGGSTLISLHPEKIEDPLHWRTPRRVFVNSLSDLFHKDVPTELIARAFSVMARTPQHTYQILTKRHARMRSLLSDGSQGLLEHLHDEAEASGLYDAPWPLPNVHVGVSVETQQWADIRIPSLRHTAAAVRFLSCEPLLGPLNLGLDHSGHERDYDGGFHWTCLDCSTDYVPIPWRTLHPDDLTPLNWVIAGGESGPGARPMDVEWIRSLAAQCHASAIPLFVKQMGSVWAKESGAADRKHGGDPAEWPEDLRVREFPKSALAVA